MTKVFKMVKKMAVLLGLITSREAIGYTWTVETLDHTTGEKRVFLPSKDKDWEFPKDVFKEGVDLYCYLSKERRIQISELYYRDLVCTNNVKSSLRMGIGIGCFEGKDFINLNKAEMKITHLYTPTGEHYGSIILKCIEK
jgi:hypothetical protein